MVPFLDLRTDLLTMLVLWDAETKWVGAKKKTRKARGAGGGEAT